MTEVNSPDEIPKQLKIGHIFVETPPKDVLLTKDYQALSFATNAKRVIIGTNQVGQFLFGTVVREEETKDNGKSSQKGMINPEIGGTALPSHPITLLDRISPQKIDEWIVNWAIEKRGKTPQEASDYLAFVKESLNMT